MEIQSQNLRPFHNLRQCQYPDSFLVVPNSFRHFTFEHPARLHHLVELERRAFSLSRLKSVRSIRDAVKCDGIEQLLVEVPAKRRAPMCLKVNQRLKRSQRLHGPFEADRSRLDSCFVAACAMIVRMRL